MSEPASTTGRILGAISIDELYGVYRENHQDEAIIDLRPTEEFQRMNIEGSISLPVDKIRTLSLDLREKRRAYLICKEGKHAPENSSVFSDLYPKVEVFHISTGGFDEWTQKKYPVVSGFATTAGKLAGDLEQNDPDFRSVIKQTRLPPTELRETITALLPPETRLFHFTDRNRNCYLVCDSKRRKAVVINPIMEIHHHIIDQMIRSNCDCDGVIHFENLKIQDSPSPSVHAKDLAGLVLASVCNGDDLHPIQCSPWNEQLTYLKIKQGEVLIFHRIAFTAFAEKVTSKDWSIQLPLMD